MSPGERTGSPRCEGPHLIHERRSRAHCKADAGRACARCNRARSNHRLCSADSAIVAGVAVEHRGNLGRRFFRGEASDAEGSGLGLSLVERIAGLHGTTTNYGEGSNQRGKIHLEAAERAGISHEDIGTIVKLSAFIKGKAASHVEHLAESLDKPEVAYGQEVSACC